MRKLLPLLLLCLSGLWGAVYAQSITITSPNGGENLDGCVAHTITWTATGTSTSFSIDYSIDNGANWTSVASFFNSTNGTFSWTVPNVTSSTALVRVYDSNSPTTVDVSDAVFSINGPLQLIAPNGSESWVAGSVQTIAWAASAPSNNYRLEYSTDNGATWSTIVSGISGASGSYAWTVPNISSTTAIVRVTDLTNSSCTTDKSDAVFNLVSEISVTMPNGGEIWEANTVANGGTFLMNNTPVTVSTGNFYDSGGPTADYTRFEDYTKTFTPANPENKLRVYFKEFRTYGSADKLYIYNGPTTSDPLIGSYDNTDNIPIITSSHKTGALTFRFDANYSSFSQVDSGWSAIITSIGPGTQSIDWATTGTSGTFDLEYSTNSGLSWTRIVTEWPGNLGAFSWPVPNTPSTNARVRVIDSENSNIVDQSDADFTIGSATPVYVVCTPTAGVDVFPDVTYTITWLSAFASTSNVMLEYSADGGSTWNTIEASTLNDGTYDWTPPLDPSSNAQIRISEVGTPANNGVSAFFNLRPYFTITNPNGGEALQGCDLETISYIAGGASSARIDLSTDGGSTWQTIYSSVSTSSNNYNWRVLNVSSTNCLLRIYDPNDPTKMDQTDATFSISGTNHLTLNQPNGGENWIAGNTYPITYTRNISVVPGVNIQYSTNQGVTWTTIANNEQSGSYNWTIPNINVDSALVRVVSTNNSCISDQSNGTFQMVSEITLMQPNGGEILQATAGLNGGPYILMNGNDVTLSTGNFFDSGGPTGNYQRGENFTKVFRPSNPGHKVRVDFELFDTRDATLFIYNGESTSAPLVGSYDNTDPIPVITSTDKSGALTFRWTSSSSSWASTDFGWEAHITTVSPENYDVQWSYIGTSEIFHYEYSTNGGSTWTRILSDVPATTGQFSWPIPNTPTTQGRFRVVDADNGDIIDESDADFTILAAEPTYYVCAPEAGDDWFADEVRKIEWNSVFTSNPNVNIDVSLDDGATWSPVVASTFDDGEYDWTVPNTPSTQARIRVSDPTNVTYGDTSGRFDIRTYITILSPNGGESFTGCDNVPISLAAGGTSGTYRLELSTDGGTTWNTETFFSNNGNFFTYNWTASNITSNNCLLRVSDNSDASKVDQSDAAFTLNQTLNVQVGQPNGNETWVAGNTYPIIYNTQGGVTNVRIFYSLDSGMTWTQITSNHSGGVYNWTIPNVDSDLAMVRVQDVSTPCNADASNAVFSLLSEIAISSPNGGEVLNAVGGLNGGNFLMDNNDVTLTVGNFYDDGGPNSDYTVNRDYTKTFTPSNPTHKLQVVFSEFETYNSSDRLFIYNGPTTSDPLVGTYDNSDFIPVITSTHKSGALTFRFDANNTVSSRNDIGWDAYIVSIGPDNSSIDWTTTGTSGDFHLEYSTNSGVTWNRILTNLPVSGAANFSWPVPNTPSTTARVRVVDADNGQIVDVSDADFTIQGAEPLYEFCTPTVNETLLAGQQKDITWVSAFTTNGFVNLEYSLDAGATWLPIAMNTINDGSHIWTVPNNPMNGAWMRVSDATNSAHADTLMNVNLGPWVRLNSPNGGQNLTGCDNYNISWTAGATSGTFRLELSTDGGSSWTSIANVSNSNTNVSYNWTVSNLTSTNCLIRVYDIADTTKMDVSDASFTVNQTLNVQVFQPNGGETWVAGNTYQITYNLQGGVSSARLMYSLNNGVNWTTIATNQNSGAYSWTVPNVDSDVALIRVQDMSTSCNADNSDANFSLVSEIALTYPNGGDTLTPSGGPNGGSFLMNNTPVTITTGRFYDTGGPTGNYGINQNFTKTFYPFNPTHKLKVTFEEFETYTSSHRLSIYNGPTTSSPLVGTYDYNDPIPVITSTHKTGALTFVWTSPGSSWNQTTDFGWDAYFVSEGADNTTVTYTTTGTSGEYDYEFSTNGGLTWNTILSGVTSNSSSFSWPVPNTPTTQGRFRVVDSDNGAILDESDTDFVIQLRDPLYVICEPSGNEIFYAGRTETIEWNSAYTTNAFVDIEYSVDSGMTWLPLAMNTINDGEEDWVIPNNPSTNTFIRVSDASNPAFSGMSNRFTLRSYVFLTNPNGGQSYTGCDNVTIGWAAGLNSGSYRIELSTDNGSTWTTVANVNNTSSSVSYNWTVPNINSANCLIRVYDTADNTRMDQSTSTFSITPTLNVVLGQPNGGENWVAGNTYPITYTLQGGVTQARLEYSLNGGINWSTIASSQSTGLYNWTVPNVDSDQAMVRVRDQSNSCNADMSDSLFSIVSELEILTPNGGDTLKAITGPTATFFTMDNTPVTVCNGNFYDSGGPTGNYQRGESYTKTFTPYNPTHKLQVNFTDFRLNGSYAQLRVYNGPSTSDPLFGTYSSTTSVPVLTSTHKSGALTFVFTSNSSSWASTERGWKAVINSITPDAYDITWNVIGTSEVYDLEYSTDGGSNWHTIVRELPTGTTTFPWAVPNLPTNQGRIRVVDAGNNQILDGSDQNFVIQPADPLIVVCHPDGGEVFYPDVTETIEWAHAFNGVGTVMIEYSTDDGATWTVINANTANDGEYDWVVPRVRTDSARVRVTSNVSGHSEMSANRFRIVDPISLTYPNSAGITFQGCEQRNITWNSDGTSGVYDISLSTDGGATWTAIRNNYTNNSIFSSLSWTVTNLSSTNCLIAVTDDQDPTKTDTSDVPFTINQSFDVQVLSPNGGEFWVAGTQQSIVYNLSGTSTGNPVDIFYTTGGGLISIANNVTGGSYTWTIPNTPSNTAQIMIRDDQNTCKVDYSNSDFNIVSEVAITSPNGGEVWLGRVGTPGGNYVMNSTQDVTLNSGNFFDMGGENSDYAYNQNVTRTFYPDIGTNKLEVTFTDFALGSSDYLRVYNGPTTSSPLLGSYTWTSTPGTLTSTHPSGALTFRFTSDNYKTPSRPERGWEAYFNSISPSTPEYITWNVVGTSGIFNIEYSTNGGTTWTTIVEEYPSALGQWPWQVPNTPSTNCLVRVTDSQNGNIVDVSDNPFEISPAIPLLINPNGGETAFGGIPFTVEWASPTFLSANVQLEYSTNNGVTWNLIQAFTFNDGEYDWVPPQTNTPFYNCLIRISESGNTIKNDISDANFTLSPPIRITTPNGNTGNFRGCTQSTIDWVAGASNSYTIELSLDSGSTWSVVESNYINSNSVVNYPWSIPNTPSEKCLVRVTDNNNPTRMDMSDSVFTITPTITLTYPNFGGQVQAGSNITITWNSNVVSNFYDIDYSTNGGASWTNIVTNHFTTTDSYNWTVPTALSTNCRIRVRDNLENCKEDRSDYPFTIQAAAPSITLTSPTGTDTLNGCTGVPITWTELLTSNFYNIEYSFDGGANWTTIISNYFTTTGSYSWNVPNVSTNDALIRITDAADPAKTDVSNQSFVIEQSVSASITASGATTICLGDTVFLTSSSPVGNVWAPFGQTTQTIAVTQSGSYEVAVTSAGCVANSVPVQVTVNSLPATPTITASGPTVICAGDPLVLTSSSPSGNSWSPTNQTTQAISITASGIYQVTATNQFGCSATSNAMAVTVNPIPQTPGAGSNSPVSLGATINLTATTVAGATYAWTGPNGFTSSQQNPSILNADTTMSGTYTVVATIGSCQSNPATVNVTVTPNSSIVNISGRVESEMGSPVRSTTLQLTGTAIDSMTTGLNGEWNFDVAIGQAYTVTPEKYNDTVTNNGVTTLDLILMRRHILNVDTLNSPYKILAADVNFSNDVSTLDLILTRAVILQTNTTFPNGMLWNFVSIDYVFANPISPWPYEDFRTYASATSLTDQDFVGVKLGDVNNTWDPNVARTPWAGEIPVYMEDVTAAPGEEILLPVMVDDFVNMSGYQMTLEWNPDALDYLEAIPGELAGQFGEGRIIDGKLATSWDEPSGSAVTLENGSALFYVRFRVKGDLDKESLVFIGSSMARAEAYTDDLHVKTFRTQPVRVKVFEQASGAESALLDGYSLSQNVPNPFAETTELNFRLPIDTEAAFVIYDMNGQEIRRFREQYEAGDHLLIWNGTDQQDDPVSGGVYYIRMVSGDFTATRKMILIRK